MNPADKFLIFFGLLDLFYDYPLDFGPIIHPQFFFLIYGIFWQCDQFDDALIEVCYAVV